MSTLVPTPVTLEDLLDDTSAINVIDAAAAQAVSPRFNALDKVTVKVTDDPSAPGLEGVCTANVANKLTDSNAPFANVAVGDTAFNTETGVSAVVTVVDSTSLLTFGSDIFPDGDEAYKVIAIADMGYYTQRNLLGEWIRNDKLGNNKNVNYKPTGTLAVVNAVVLPITV